MNIAYCSLTALFNTAYLWIERPNSWSCDGHQCNNLNTIGRRKVKRTHARIFGGRGLGLGLVPSVWLISLELLYCTYFSRGRRLITALEKSSAFFRIANSAFTHHVSPDRSHPPPVKGFTLKIPQDHHGKQLRKDFILQKERGFAVSGRRWISQCRILSEQRACKRRSAGPKTVPGQVSLNSISGNGCVSDCKQYAI